MNYVERIKEKVDFVQLEDGYWYVDLDGILDEHALRTIADLLSEENKE